MVEELREKVRKVVDYFRYHNKNLTGTQDLMLYELEEAQKGQKENGLKRMGGLVAHAAELFVTKTQVQAIKSFTTALLAELK